MSVKLPAIIHAVLSRQDLASDDVSYEIELTLLGVQLRIPCPEQLIGRIDEMLRGEPPQRTQAQQSAAARKPATRGPQEISGYDVGVLEDYDVEDNV